MKTTLNLKHLVAAVCLVFVCTLTARAEALPWFTDLELAKKEAQRTSRPIFLLFTGGNWCGVCVQMERTILSQPQFAAYAAEHLVLVKVDFKTPPFSHSATPDQSEPKHPAAEQANYDLARRFNVNIGQPDNGRGLNGYPSVFILTPQGEPVTQVNTNIVAATAGVQPYLKDLDAAVTRSKAVN